MPTSQKRAAKQGHWDNTQNGAALLRSHDGKKRVVKLISMQQVFWAIRAVS